MIHALLERRSTVSHPNRPDVLSLVIGMFHKDIPELEVAETSEQAMQILRSRREDESTPLQLAERIARFLARHDN